MALAPSAVVCVPSRGFESAITALNSLIKMDVQPLPKGPPPRLAAMRRNLESLGITQTQLSALNMVHVTGTKGKGSTCAFVESILRACGRKTGMYTSPHLINHTERIKINGRSVPQDMFADSFWRVHDRLLSGERSEMPPNYFETLTAMAFDVFVREHVDVAVVEVGAGGRCDPTNVADSPAVCAVAPVGLDHVKLLGPTRCDIAREKSGIFKHSSPAVVSADQYPDAMSVLVDAAKTVGAPLVVAPELPEHLARSISLEGEFQRTNAALATQVCREWLARRGERLLDQQLAAGLASARWAGRAQRLVVPDTTGKLELFLDGAHTVESARAAGAWFARDVSREPVGCRRALVFACTAGRDPTPLLRELKESGALRGAVIVFAELPKEPGRPVPFHTAQMCKDAWVSVGGALEGADMFAVAGGPAQALAKLREIAAQSNEPVKCLVSGSLYLVGSLLSLCRFEID